MFKYIMVSGKYYNTTIWVDKKEIETTKEFKYLGSYLTDGLNPGIKIKRSLANIVFQKMKNLLINDTLRLNTKKRFIQMYFILQYDRRSRIYSKINKIPESIWKMTASQDAKNIMNPKKWETRKYCAKHKQEIPSWNS